MTPLKRTFLTEAHQQLGAKLVPFSGYNMPVQYKGIIEEHNWVRNHAGLFDISHMGVIRLTGPEAKEVLEKLTPANLTALNINQCKYTFILNDHAGIEDDIIITKEAEDSYIVVINAGRKDHDINIIQSTITNAATQLTYFEDAPLLALQGPEAVSTFEALYKVDLSNLKFMQATELELDGVRAFVSRTGYTGEDGLEIALLHHATLDDVTKIWDALLKQNTVEPIGLGARDSLRLESGLALYGQDLTTETTPIEASLGWALDSTNTKHKGHGKITLEKETGVAKKRIGLKLIDKGVLRHDYKVFTTSGEEAGIITSGGFCPSSGESIAQAYIKAEYLTQTDFLVEVRKRKLKAEKHALRFYTRNK